MFGRPLSPRRHPLTPALVTALLGLATSATPAFAQTTLYSSNFGSGTGGLSGFTTSGGAVRTDNGVTYLGNLTGGSTATLMLNTAGYTSLRLAFTLYGVLTLDGNGPAGGGADPFLVGDASGTIFNYTFANYTGGNTQSYCGATTTPAMPGTILPAGMCAPRTGQVASNQLGFGTGDSGDATYRFANFALTPGAGGMLTLTFTGASNQGVGDEFYGINNVVITGTAIPSSTVPEPATWALLGTGLLTVGGVARRRRTA